LLDLFICLFFHLFVYRFILAFINLFIYFFIRELIHLCNYKFFVLINQSINSLISGLIKFVCLLLVLQESSQLLELLAKPDDLMMLTLAHLISPPFLHTLYDR